MLLLTPGKRRESKGKADKFPQKQVSTNSAKPKNVTKQIFSRLRISQKIGYGYALAIGIAILGTGIGMGVGDYFRKQALYQLNIAQQQQELLQGLQNSVFQARMHASRLPVVLGDLVWLKYENSQFLEQINSAKILISRSQTFIETNSSSLPLNRDELLNLLRKYAITIDYYGEMIKLQLKESNAWNIKPNQIVPTQLQLLRNVSGEEALLLDRLSDNLTQQISAISIQKLQGVEGVQYAEALRTRIIIGSMLISAIIAAVLAYYTSRAIAQPLETVTNVAQQVTRESNFHLQTPVTTEDEVGSLAISFNQLIQRVADYTKELKQTQSQLIQTEKMSSLGQMVAGIAHEINNPINFIHGNIEHADGYINDLIQLLALYQQHYPEPIAEIQNQIEAIELDFLSEDLPKILSSMKIGADRIRELVISLRNFSRLDECEMKITDIREGIDSTLVILNYRVKQGIKIIKEYGELPPINCYPAQLNQVFMNIISNGIDALEELGDSDSTIWINAEASESNCVKVKIRDNGPGMPPEIQENIFDPFFTTKSIGKGTGLGLAISYQIITKHHGTIEVNSQPGKGTEFVITLPISG
ncbi:ATP-binding protein [Kamptonema animale CS-326]|jgi:two-component system NtrC family sensor kinase|uniref:sensor histidine kinase n=1 Tax=Kamptonema animale TaxID=92934 RepID=UPI00232D63C7|nr:ATP-binding protein [Kamptonema animale]MDB9511019.1 ATP-binding protein [Kamptonema animale CS-326]